MVQNYIYQSQVQEHKKEVNKERKILEKEKEIHYNNKKEWAKELRKKIFIFFPKYGDHFLVKFLEYKIDLKYLETDIKTVIIFFLLNLLHVFISKILLNNFTIVIRLIFSFSIFRIILQKPLFYYSFKYKNKIYKIKN